MEATDTPMSEESAIEALMQPIETEEETEAVEAPQEEETETEEVETEDDASEVTDEETDEDDDLSEEDDDASDDDDEEDESDDGQSADLHTTTVDGEEVQVTLEEALRGYSGQRKIQKGMEENAQARRELEAQAQTLQQNNQMLQQLYTQAQQTGFTPAPQMPDAALRQTDPLAYYEAKDDYDRQMAQYQTEQQQIQHLQQQQAAQSAEQQRQHMAAQEQILLQEMPELKDPEKAEAFKKSLKAAGDGYGYTQDELREIVKDVRSVKALADAQKWRDLQANKKTAKVKREPAKAVTRPKGKTRNPSKVNFQKGLKKALQSGSKDDFAALLFDPNS